jgi:hypothetical protein
VKEPDVINTRATHLMRQLKRFWDEMDYAQRRLLELNFEVPLQGGGGDRAEIEELEALYRLKARVPGRPQTR